jgi:hypothetical protein
MGTADEDQISDLRNYLRGAAENDDGNKCCNPGPGGGLLNTIASVYAVASMLAAACMIMLPGMAWMIHGWTISVPDVMLFRKVAAVLLVSARPSAVLIAKTAPFWCSVATSARHGFVNQQHLEILLGRITQPELPDLPDLDDFASDQQYKRRKIEIGIVRALQMKTTQNLVVSVVGRLITLLTLARIVIHNRRQPVTDDNTDAGRWQYSPWNALLVELVVTSIIALNSTRCVYPKF